MSISLSFQVGGDHYKTVDHKYQPIEVSRALALNPTQHTALKYLSRNKDKAVDLVKALHTSLIGYEQRECKPFMRRSLEVCEVLFIKEFCKIFDIDDTLVFLIYAEDYKTLCDKINEMLSSLGISTEAILGDYKILIKEIKEKIEKDRSSDNV